MRQEDLATRIGLHQSTLSDIERGEAKALAPDLIQRLAVALGVEPSEIWDWPTEVVA